MKVLGKLRQRVKDRRAASRQRYVEKQASKSKDMGGAHSDAYRSGVHGGPPTGP